MQEPSSSTELINTRNINPGEYQLHIFIEGVKDLVPPKSDSSTINPILSLTAFSEERSMAFKPVSSNDFVSWHEHFFFRKKIDSFLDFEQQKLVFRLYDSKFLGFKALIGEFEMIISPIYFGESHSMMYQWIALTNSHKEEISEIQGFLKFSANLVGPEEQVTKLGPEALKDENRSDLKPVIYSPQIQTKPFQIRIQLIRGEKLAKMDSIGGSIDSYIIVRFGNVSYKSEVIKNNLNPIWGYEIMLPFSEPCITSNLEIQLYDWDFPTKDEIVASTFFLKDELKRKKNKNTFTWVNLYGSQIGSSNEENALIMNSSPSLASFWKGRILLAMDIFDHPQPKLTSQPDLLPPEITTRFQKSAVIQWKLYMELFYGLLFPKTAEAEYSIQVRWADYEVHSEKIKGKTGVWEIFTRLSLVCDFPYFNADELPDVFIYLIRNNTRICFLRKPASLFLHQFNAIPAFYYFAPDKAMVPDLNDDEAGILKMRCVVAVAQAISDLSIGGWNQPLRRKIEKKGVILAHINQAQDLLPADEDGNSDPFLEASFYGAEGKTPVVNDTLNPIWYHTIKLEVPLFDLNDMPPIVVRVYDEDAKKNEFIGSSTIYIEEGLKNGLIKINEANVPSPQWLPLRYSKESVCGKILVSFNVFDERSIVENQGFLRNLSILPDMDLFRIKLKVMGLRNLKSLGLIPVKRAFIRFDINSIRSPSQKQALPEKKFIQTMPKEAGDNPNILTIIDFTVKLPKDFRLCPHLNCVVFDCVFKGLFQPCLGVFSIDLGKFLEKTHLKLKKKALKEQNLGKENKPILEPILPQNENENQNASFRRPSEEEKFIETSVNEQVSSKKTGPYQVLPEESPALPVIIEMQEIKDIIKNKPRPILFKVISKEGKIVNSSAIIIPAEYQFNRIKKSPLEVNIPPSSEYIPMGFDSKADRYKGNIKKHYRFYIDKPLENSPFLPETPFDEFTLMRGKRLTKFAGLSEKKEGSGLKEVGKFKGWISVESELERNAEKPDKSLDLDREYMQKSNCIVRVYVISAFGLAQLDSDSLSDPYLKVVLGNIVVDNEKECQTDKTDCDFFRMFELKAVFPGDTTLKVQVWDKDLLTSDELIGETIIDLENRYFSKKFRSLRQIPIETRDLYHPLSTLNRGRLRMFLEIFPVSKLIESPKPWEIQPRPPTKFQIRMIIWELEDMPDGDIEGVSDLYVTGELVNSSKKLKTDVHYRAQNGKGVFNWRMVWDVEVPSENYEVKIQAWDKDLVSSDDFMGEYRLDFREIALEALETENEVKIKDKQTVELKKGNKKVGKLVYSFEFIPWELAEKSKVGQGRDEPNHSPWLEPPIGRFEWALNPLTLFNSCMSLKMRAKICMAICTILCVAFIIYQFPVILGKVIVDSIIL